LLCCKICFNLSQFALWQCGTKLKISLTHAYTHTPTHTQTTHFFFFSTIVLGFFFGFGFGFVFVFVWLFVPVTLKNAIDVHNMCLPEKLTLYGAVMHSVLDYCNRLELRLWGGQTRVQASALLVTASAPSGRLFNSPSLPFFVFKIGRSIFSALQGCCKDPRTESVNVCSPGYCGVW